MNSLKDVVYNWLSIKLVADSRPFDSAARETMSMFEEILQGDFQAKVKSVQLQEHVFYVETVSDGEITLHQFPKDYVSNMLTQIQNQADKYQNFHEAT